MRRSVSNGRTCLSKLLAQTPESRTASSRSIKIGSSPRPWKAAVTAVRSSPRTRRSELHPIMTRVAALGATALVIFPFRWNEPWRPFERRWEQVQAAEHASDGFRTPQGSALLRDRVGSLHRGSDDSVWDGAIRASLRSSGDERMLGAVAKKRAVGSRKRIGSSHGVCPPHTLDRAAALDARRDLIEVHAKIRVCMTQTGVPFDLLLAFTLNAHIPVIGFAPQKVARTTRRHPCRFLTQSGAS